MVLDRKLRRKLRSLWFWLNLKEQQTLDIFSLLPNAVKVGNGDKQYVYVPGTRADRVLLIAHADTVWHGSQDKVSVKYDNGVYSSANKEFGTGGDDRCGCAILWRLRNLGHSLLIPNMEEKQCAGSKFLMSDKKMSDEVNSHQFMVEFDRKGGSDLVFYDVWSSDFVTWCQKEFKGFKRDWQCSSTDIKYLCRDICGVNISVGYTAQHTASEKICVKSWLNTLNIAREVLQQSPLPKFIKPASPWNTNQSNNSYSATNHRPAHQHNSVRYRNNQDKEEYTDCGICPICHGLYDLSEVYVSDYANDRICPFKACQKAI